MKKEIAIEIASVLRDIVSVMEEHREKFPESIFTQGCATGIIHCENIVLATAMSILAEAE